LSPRVHRLKPGWIAFFLLGAMFFLGLAIWLARLPEAESAWMVPLFFAGFGLFTLLPLRTRARVIARALTALVFLCFLWVLLFRRPYHAAIVANILLPLIALLLLA
jgi:hypothetical protein